MKKKYTAIYVFLAAISLGACGYQMPAVRLSQPDIKDDLAADSIVLETKMREYVQGIIEKKLEIILKQIDPEKGALDDFKAPNTYADLELKFSDPESAVYRAYWQDTDIKSFRAMFSDAGEIKLKLYFYNDEECEIELLFEGRPSRAVLINPIYHKRNGSWYLARFL